MSKATLAEAKAFTDWTRFTNLCVTDTRLRSLINEATMRLRPKGKWVGTWQRYRICAPSACVTWPRQIETIEAAWICNRPITIRNGWFETLPNSFGMLNSESGPGSVLIDRGAGFTGFADLSGTAKIALVNTQPLDAGKTVLLQGRDGSNGNYVRTVNDNVDGELVTLVNGTVVSTTTWAPPGLVGVQKEVTRAPVRAYAVDPSCPSGTVASIAAYNPMALAYWEPDETLPNYRRSLVPGLQNGGSCSTCAGTTSDCTTTQLTVIAKLNFIPVVKDSDYLQIGNLPAIKEEVQSILKRERGLIDEAEAHEAVAVRLLEEELSSYEGHGVVTPLKVDSASMFGGGGVDNYVTPVGGYWAY
jgi:hypothetical protein